MNSKLKVVFLVAAFGLLFGRNSLVADIVVNGGFETGLLPPWVQSGDIFFTGVGIIGSIPHSGSYSFAIGSPTDGFLSQTLVTIPLATYELRYWLHHGLGAIPIENYFNVSWDGSLIPGATLVDAPAFDYTEYIFPGLIASTASTVLTFGPYFDLPTFYNLDDISVERTDAPVPEPGTLFLLGTGLIGLGAQWKRRLKK